MRIQRKDEQHLYYAEQTDGRIPVYEKDSNGNIIYDNVDGELVPRETGDYTQAYGAAVSFDGFLTWDVSEAQARSFGMALGTYSGVLTVLKDQLDIKETGLIFWKNKPIVDNGVTVNAGDADYRVMGIIPSINFTRYVLRKNE